MTDLWPTSVFYSVAFQPSESLLPKRLMLPLEQHLRQSLVSTRIYTPSHMHPINTHTHMTVLHICAVSFFLAAQLSVNLLPMCAKIIGLWKGEAAFCCFHFFLPS